MEKCASKSVGQVTMGERLLAPQPWCKKVGAMKKGAPGWLGLYRG